jgi:hypothetical protein
MWHELGRVFVDPSAIVNYNAQDFYGHRWDITETIADVAPEEWSGGEFHLE